ncbi:hypothetical protein [Rhizobium sp. CECT 9324]|jgi:hypothetical protein|uniref:hypothetical protein n=1 Tax=Rhizobium sp. CECT 9324 TaxID=2845820 RepID=UPI000DDC7E41|nr:hypothetical protein [Rhizobium sp. CECT 9324]CAH0339456.1 hypothetical protein RHI9324_01105 [Rhizobium sp. CECT 9324]
MSEQIRRPRWRRHSDPRDRLILALSAQLDAERQKREALRLALGRGTIDPAFLRAIAEEPVVADSEDIAALQQTLALREQSLQDDHPRETWI